MNITRIIAIILICLLPLTAFGGQLSGLADFAPGTVITSNDVNTNFTSTEDEVTDNHNRITTLEASDVENQPLVIRAVDVGTAGYEDGDIEAAFDACVVANPTAGCIIELLDVTYTDVRVSVPGQVREIRAAGDNTVLLAPTAIQFPDEFGADAYSLLEIHPSGITTGGNHNVAFDGGSGVNDGTDFEHGLWIHGFTVDGNKQNLLAPGATDGRGVTQAFNIDTVANSVQAHRGIEFNDTTAVLMYGVVVEDMIIRNFASEGINLEQTPGAVVRNVLAENFGCWDNDGITEPNDTLSSTYADWQPDGIAATEMACGLWSDAQTQTLRGWDNPGTPNSGYQPGVITEGTGIEINCYSDRVVVENSTVRYSTKLGMQTFCNNSNEAIAPEFVKLVNNDVSWVASVGILSLGSNYTIIEGNRVSNIRADWSYGNTGYGISCSRLGRFNSIIGNTIINTSGSGLVPSCECGLDIGNADYTCNAVVADNVVVEPCQQNLAGGPYPAISLNTGQSSFPPQAQGLTVHNNKVIRPGAFCASGFADEGAYADLTLTGDIASGATQITDGISSIGANICATVVTEAAPQVATTDNIDITFNTDATLVTGYGPGPSDGIAIYAYPEANEVNFKACNMTGTEITPGALTVNWRVTR